MYLEEDFQDDNCGFMGVTVVGGMDTKFKIRRIKIRGMVK